MCVRETPSETTHVSYSYMQVVNAMSARCPNKIRQCASGQNIVLEYRIGISYWNIVLEYRIGISVRTAPRPEGTVCVGSEYRSRISVKNIGQEYRSTEAKKTTEVVTY